MKLFELIDDNVIRDEFETAEEWFMQLDDYENEESEALGAGAYSAVVPTDIPGEVKKILYNGGGDGFDSVDEIKKDAYVIFISKIAESNATDGNPYLPRISRIDTIRGRDGKLYLNIFMERLAPLQRADVATVEAMARKMYGESKDFALMEEAFEYLENKGLSNDSSRLNLLLAPIVYQFLGGRLSPPVTRVLYNAFRQDMGNKLIRAIAGDESIKITDDRLMDAVNLVSNLGKDTTIDFHFNNAMMRRTSVGPQLVIIDPVV